jgi:hypothetical protein
MLRRPEGSMCWDVAFSFLANSSLLDRLKGMSVDDFLGAGFMEGSNDEVFSPRALHAPNSIFLGRGPGDTCFRRRRGGRSGVRG